MHTSNDKSIMRYCIMNSIFIYIENFKKKNHVNLRIWTPFTTKQTRNQFRLTVQMEDSMFYMNAMTKKHLCYTIAYVYGVMVDIFKFLAIISIQIIHLYYNNGKIARIRASNMVTLLTTFLEHFHLSLSPEGINKLLSVFL